MSNEKNIYWQSVRGICILAVVLIHSLQCYDFNNGIVIIRQIINFAVAIFVFMAWFLFYYLGLQVRNGMKLKCNLGFVIGTWILSCFEAFALRMLGMEVGFYTSQITFGSFLYATAVIGLILKNAEKNMLNKTSVIKKIGDCSYGVFYIHMLILSIVKRFIINENWLIVSMVRFIFTALISFAIVCIGRLLLKKHEKALKIVGFI